MAEHGGYRTPSNPAPVSGPGAHSARTDRGPKQHDLTGGSYGEGKAFQEQQSAAPLSAGGPSASTGAPAPDFSSLVGLGAPTSMPDVPITDGASAGAGVGPEAMFGKQIDPQSEEARSLGRYLGVLIEAADSAEATPAFKRYVRQLYANL